MWTGEKNTNEEQNCRWNSLHSFLLTHHLKAVPPILIVWLTLPITSEFGLKQHIFGSYSVPQQQPAVMNPTAEYKQQEMTQNVANRWMSSNWFDKKALHNYLTLFLMDHGCRVLCRRTVINPNTVIRGNKLLMVRPTWWKLYVHCSVPASSVVAWIRLAYEDGEVPQILSFTSARQAVLPLLTLLTSGHGGPHSLLQAIC